RFAGGSDDDDVYRLYSASDDGKDWEPVPASRTGGQFIPVAFNADASRVFAWHSVDNGPMSLVESDPTGTDRTVLASDGFGSVGELEWNAARLPFAATLAHGKPRTVYFDEDSPDAAEHRMLAGLFPDHHVRYANHSADGLYSLLHV